MKLLFFNNNFFQIIKETEKTAWLQKVEVNNGIPQADKFLDLKVFVVRKINYNGRIHYRCKIENSLPISLNPYDSKIKQADSI